MIRRMCWWVGFAVGIGAFAQEAIPETAAEGTPAHPPVQVFILSGQSNAVGCNDYKQYRKGQSPLADAFMNQPGVLFWDAKTHAWTTLRVGASDGNATYAFGPEIGFAHALTQTGCTDSIAIIKCAVGGTGIARGVDYNDYVPEVKGFDDGGWNWHPPTDGREAGHLYQQLIQTVSNALSSLERDGRRYDVAAFLWMQGEHEAVLSPRMAGDYARLLKDFIRSVRTDLKTPDLPFAVGEVNSHSWAFGDIVRQGQADVCRDDGNAVLIKTTDLSREGRGGPLHFDADGTIELGIRFAEGLKPLLMPKKNNPPILPATAGPSAQAK